MKEEKEPEDKDEQEKDTFCSIQGIICNVQNAELCQICLK
jgi:hypothetical protein